MTSLLEFQDYYCSAFNNFLLSLSLSVLFRNLFNACSFACQFGSVINLYLVVLLLVMIVRKKEKRKDIFDFDSLQSVDEQFHQHKRRHIANLRLCVYFCKLLLFSTRIDEERNLPCATINSLSAVINATTFWYFLKLFRRMRDHNKKKKKNSKPQLFRRLSLSRYISHRF